MTDPNTQERPEMKLFIEIIQEACDHTKSQRIFDATKSILAAYEKNGITEIQFHSLLYSLQNSVYRSPEND